MSNARFDPPGDAVENVHEGGVPGRRILKGCRIERKSGGKGDNLTKNFITGVSKSRIGVSRCSYSINELLSIPKPGLASYRDCIGWMPNCT